MRSNLLTPLISTDWITNKKLGGFDTGPGFVFNIGGGPGVRVHQFGGAAPRRRPGTAVPPGSEPSPSLSSTLGNLLPLLFLFILPLLSSLFSGSTTAAGPSLVFEGRSPYTKEHVSAKFKVRYYVDPREVHDYNPKKWRKLDDQAERQWIHVLNVRCQNEQFQQRKMMEDAQGWFSVDQEAMQKARQMELKNCNKLRELGLDV